MTRYLLFTLYAPLASWGEIAMGEQRGSWTYPSRSAVLGLAAAALGLPRENTQGHAALDEGYGFAVRLDAPGVPLSDYHTTQTMAQSVVKKAKPATRRALLAAGDPETILSRRGYRADALATAALWTKKEMPRWALDTLAAALRRPVFTLYAGRKSNPFGLPLDPQVIEAETLAEAFAQRPPNPLLAVLRPREGWGRGVAADLLPDGAYGFPVQHHELRRDAAPDRQRWLFSERNLAIGSLPPASEGDTA